MYYGADYGMYHSIYENFHWMKTVVDPTFEYHILMSLLQGFLSLRIANADLLQLDYAGEARYWRMAYDELQATAKQKGVAIPNLKQSLLEIDRWEKEATALDIAKRNRLLRASSADNSGWRDWNRKYYLAARDFYRESGSPDSKLERNLWSGSSGILPGIAGALEKNDPAQLQSESRLYLNAVRKRVATLKRLRAELK